MIGKEDVVIDRTDSVPVVKVVREVEKLRSENSRGRGYAKRKGGLGLQEKGKSKNKAEDSGLKAQGVNLGDSVENTLNPNQRSLARRVDTILDKQKHSVVLIESFGERERSAEDRVVIVGLQRNDLQFGGQERNGEVESSYLPLGRPLDSSEEKGRMQSYSNSLFESFQGNELERNCRMGKEDDDENDSASDEHKEESEEEFRDPYMRD
ncbi:hypothetical protein GH714_034556 [Hevea brasiliensis]|uniref:Uncharacterized protein n=1 Tax=Hevea brasiliensis TaxID=3981 RepID=A0A6A6NEC4_HEVBR|nr:hypothetical protein GH714_034556 [Hevea brasiliensis]